jgi:hypothetical protein
MTDTPSPPDEQPEPDWHKPEPAKQPAAKAEPVRPEQPEVRAADGHSATHQHQQTGRDAPRRAKPAWLNRDNIGLVFDGVVTVATVIGVWFLVLQWKQTEEALHEAREANRFTSAQRQPLIDVDSFDTRALVLGLPFQIVVAFKNNGGSTAFNYQNSGNMAFGTQAAPPSIPTNPAVLRPGTIGGYVLAGKTVVLPINSPQPLTPELRAAISEGKQLAFVFGLVTYSDERGRPYRFEYCRVVSVRDLLAAPCGAPLGQGQSKDQP